MRQVIRFRNPDGIKNEQLPPTEVSFYWKREDGWIERERTVQQNTIAEVGRSLWKQLFLLIETEQQLFEWEAKIPCGTCKKFYTDWKSTNPPSFPLSFGWKYNLKSAVNAELGHPNLSFEDAFLFWNSDDARAQ